MNKLIEKIDRSFFNIFNKKMKNSFFDKFMPIYTNLGSLAFITSVLAFLLILKETRPLGEQVLFALAISQTITYFLKASVKRTRPYDALDDINTYGMILKDHSFPSGHSSASFTLATILSLNFPNLAIIFLPMAFLVAISRVYLGVHYGTDIIFGSLLGIIAGSIVYYI